MPRGPHVAGDLPGELPLLDLRAQAVMDLLDDLLEAGRAEARIDLRRHVEREVAHGLGGVEPSHVDRHLDAQHAAVPAVIGGPGGGPHRRQRVHVESDQVLGQADLVAASQVDHAADR